LIDPVKKLVDSRITFLVCGDVKTTVTVARVTKLARRLKIFSAVTICPPNGLDPRQRG
jgi:hypothetical protein